MLALTACSGANGVDPEDIVTPEEVKIDSTIVVSPLNAATNNGGVFEGWGTSLCWWANRVGYSDSLSQQAADLFYGEDGLRLNIMRYNIGGGDDPTHNHITRTDSDVPGWLVWDESTNDYVYDYDADKGQLNVLVRCVEAAGDEAIVEVFSNSPPYFMTVSGCSSGGFDPNRNNLKDDCYEDFAEYLVHVTNYIQEELGIEVASISPMNEPNTNFWGANSYKQEGCHFDAGEAQSKIIEAVDDALMDYGITNVIIAASDETSTGKQVDEYYAYSDAARNALGRINTHTYDTTRIAEMGQLANDEDFVLWMSEVDGNGFAGTNPGEMGAGLWLGTKIISDINALMPSAWVLWQVIDKHICEEGYKGRQDSGMIDVTQGFWGTAVADHDNGDIILTQKYYAFGQFTRYIRPGYTLINVGNDALAAYDKESDTLVLVCVNTSGANKMANIDLSQFNAIGTTVNVVRTSGTIDNGEQWAELEDIYTYESGFVAELLANSVTTYIVEGVECEDLNLKEVKVDNAVITGSMPLNMSADKAKNVFDGSVGTYFDGESGGWIEIDLGKETEFSVIGFAPRSGYEKRMLKSRFYGSNDGENWDLLCTVKAEPSTGMNYAFLDETQSFRYIRYDMEDGSIFSCNIAEIGLFTSSAKISNGSVSIDNSKDTVTRPRDNLDAREDKEFDINDYVEIPLADTKVTGSAPWNNGADVASKAVDGSINTFFDGVSDGWVEIDLGEETEFGAIGFCPRSGFEDRMIGGKFYGSLDGENWTELYTVGSNPSFEMNYADMGSARTYRYIKYDVPGGLCNIAEIKLYAEK
ncbi:MAG: discoidin domain-containing protein [Oscillospiraceae bacterium]|nr:discoidin domain-containing protein [Oscillospiraceae bacterium]